MYLSYMCFFSIPSYIIPNNSYDGLVNPCDIIKLYLETVENDLQHFQEFLPTLALFICGTNSDSNSTFTHEALGKNVLSKVPSMIAEWLGLTSPETYTITSFKSTLNKI